MVTSEFMLSVVESRLAEVEFGSELHLNLLRAKDILLARIGEQSFLDDMVLDILNDGVV